MDKKQQTTDTYNRSARTLATKFNSLGGYEEEIRKVFTLINKENPTVLEIGCGNGRDAKEILKYTKNYLGVDISEKLLEIAREKNPGAEFVLSDIEEFHIPKNIDAIFAFASLIHVQKDSLTRILKDCFQSLNNNGVVLMTLKFNDYYIESTKEDEFGTRTYYLYSKEDVVDLAQDFKILHNETYDLRDQRWIKVLLQKV